MHIDYSTYTLDELLDVKNNIDSKRYSERYERLCDELELRKNNGDFKARERKIEAEEEDDSEDFILEFSSDGKGIFRKLFISAFILINLSFLFFIIPKYFVSNISDVHLYTTSVDFIECSKVEIIDDETDKVQTYFDINISSGQDNFSAVNIAKRKCKKIAQQITLNDNISIWHEEGLVHQLKTNNKMLLSYSYMKPKIKELRTDGLYSYWLGLIVFWFILFKSLVNAVVPGTFTTNKSFKRN